MKVSAAYPGLPAPAVIHQTTDVSDGHRGVGSPVSAAWGQAGRATLWPLNLPEPYTVTRAWWLNGATAGTDSVDIGIYRMTDQSTGRVDLIRAMGATVTAGTSIAQEVTVFKANATNVTSGSSTTDQDTYTTASVTLKSGKFYLLSVANSHASAAPAVASITGGTETWTVTDATNGTTTFNSGAMRLSIWKAAPTADYTGTISIAFGASSGTTGAIWSLTEWVGNDGSAPVVQIVTATGNSTSPSVTLAAFGATANATFGAIACAAGSAIAPGTGFTEQSDNSIATPTMVMQTEWTQANDTSVDGTVTSGEWAIIGAEIKASTASLIIPPCPIGATGDIYLAHVVSGGTTRIYGGNMALLRVSTLGVLGIAATAIPLPTFATAVTTQSNSNSSMVGGFSNASKLA